MYIYVHIQDNFVKDTVTRWSVTGGRVTAKNESVFTY